MNRLRQENLLTVKTALGIRGKIISTLLALALPICAAYKARAADVPEDFRVYDNYANVSVLDDYNEVNLSTLCKIQPYGLVKFVNGDDVPAGHRLWFLDQGEKPTDPSWNPSVPFYPDKQVIGVVDIEPEGGVYYFNPVGPDRYMYGDDPFTDYNDEGAQLGDIGLEKGEEITIIAQAPNNKFYRTHYVEGSPLLVWGFVPLSGGNKRNDIVVESNEVAMPVYVGMQALGDFTYWWLADDCEEPNLWVPDPNLYGCERLDADWDGDIDFGDFAYFGQHWDPNASK